MGWLWCGEGALSFLSRFEIWLGNPNRNGVGGDPGDDEAETFTHSKCTRLKTGWQSSLLRWWLVTWFHHKHHIIMEIELALI